MRCRACDVDLKDHESKRKGLFSKEYVDLCDPCFETVADDIPLSTGNDVTDDILATDLAVFEDTEWNDELSD